MLDDSKGCFIEHLGICLFKFVKKTDEIGTFDDFYS